MMRSGLDEAFALFDACFSKGFMSFGSGYDTGNGYGFTYSVPQFPPTNVEMDKETKDLYFTFALAGYEPDEIDVKFDGDYMVLSSEIKHKEDVPSLAVLRKGIKKSSFAVKYTVPVSKYDTDRTRASFKEGLLSVVIPAREDMKPKTVKIKTE